MTKLEAAFVLHLRPFKNSSGLVELLTKNSGRVTAVANGVKRPAAAKLRSFTKINLVLSGKHELKTIIKIEQQDKSLKLNGVNTYCGLYLNELAIKLLAKGEGADFYKIYAGTLDNLAKGLDVELALRNYEYQLLSKIGLAYDLTQDIDGKPICQNTQYTAIKGAGLKTAGENSIVSGSCLRSFIKGSLVDKTCARSLRRLMYIMLDEGLGGKPVHSRKLVKDYLKLRGS